MLGLALGRLGEKESGTFPEFAMLVPGVLLGSALALFLSLGFGLCLGGATGIGLSDLWVFFGVKPLRACHTPSLLGVRGGWKMELILKPKPMGLGGASPSQFEGAYSLLLSEKEHWKTKCFQLVGAVGPLTQSHPVGSFTPYSSAPPHPHGVCTPPCSWGPLQASHCLRPHQRPVQFPRSADRATQVGVDDLRRGAPLSHISVGTSTPADFCLHPPGCGELSLCHPHKLRDTPPLRLP